MKYYLSSPFVEKKDVSAVNKVLKKGILYPDAKIENQFSKSIKKFSGYKYNLPLASGTASLHLALKIIGIKKNDQVIVSSMNFIGGVAPVLYLEAKPIFVDIDETFTICYSTIKKIVQRKKLNIKAIIITDLYGQPANEEKIVKFSKKYNIPVISDSAESFGSSHHYKILNKSAIKIFSFNSNKIITGGSGGCFSTNNKIFFNKALKLSRHSKDNYPFYQHSEVGFNYRLNSLATSLINSQIVNLKKRLSGKKYIFRKYHLLSNKNNNYHFSNFNYNKSNCNWLIVLELNEINNKINPTKLVKFLNSKKIEARHLWKPMHMQPIFNKKYRYYGSGFDEKKFKSCICLPSNFFLKDSDIKYIVKNLINFFN